MTLAVLSLGVVGAGFAVAVLLLLLGWRRERPTERHYGGGSRSQYWERHEREHGR